jgi:hypothetical protein
VKLIDELLPRYDADKGPLTAKQLKLARSLVSQDRIPTSALFNVVASAWAKSSRGKKIVKA